MATRYYNPETGTMTFGLALEALERGERVTRLAWQGAALRLERFPRLSNEPYLVQQTRSGEQRLWTVSHADLFACDWKQLFEPTPF
jgi:hypothetical protein